jgi:predicted DNA-binding transcriptional regulator AlpA
MPKVIVRPKEAYRRTGLGRTSFKKEFLDTGRLVPVPLGRRAVGYLESEVDELIDELAANRKPPLRRPKLGKAVT